MKSGKFSLKDARKFERGDFYGFVYFTEQPGLEMLEVHVDGVHPEKTIDIATRVYRVEEGTGTFTIDGTSYEVEMGDMFVINKGSSYSYTGKMKLLETNLTK